MVCRAKGCMVTWTKQERLQQKVLDKRATTENVTVYYTRELRERLQQKLLRKTRKRNYNIRELDRDGQYCLRDCNAFPKVRTGGNVAKPAKNNAGVEMWYAEKRRVRSRVSS